MTPSVRLDLAPLERLLDAAKDHLAGVVARGERWGHKAQALYEAVRTVTGELAVAKFDAEFPAPQAPIKEVPIDPLPTNGGTT